MADLKVKLNADVRKYEKALRKAERDTKGFGDKLGKTAKVAGAALAGVGVAAGAMTKKFLSAGDDLDKMSGRTGIAVEELQKFGFAAEQSGTDLATFEKAILKQSKILNDAKDGLASATDSLDALGVSVEDLDGLNPDEQFLVLADALSEVDDAGERAALAQEIFGKSGAQLLPLVKDGADGITALGDQLEETGNIMSTEAATAAAQFNDSMNVLKQQGLAAGQEAFAALAPTLANVADKFANMSPKTKLVTAGLVAAVPAAAKAGEVLRGLSGVTQALSGVKKAFVAVVNAERLATLRKTVATVAATVAEKAATAGQWLLNAALSANPIGIVIIAITALVAALVVAYTKSETFREIVQNVWEKVRAAFETAIAAIMDGWNTFYNAFKPVWETIWGGVKATFQTVWTLISEAFQTAIDLVRDTFRVFKAVFTGDWEEAWEAVKDLFANVWNKIWGAFSTAVDNIVGKFRGLRDKLGDVWDSILGKIDRIWGSITRTIKGAVNEVIGFINRLIRGWNKLTFKIPEITLPKVDLPFGRSIGGGTFGGQKFSFPDLPEIPKLARGGVVTRPTVALVGESGPEAVVPLGRGMGVTVNFYGDFYGDPTSLGDQVAVALQEWVRRNGPLERELVGR